MKNKLKKIIPLFYLTAFVLFLYSLWFVMMEVSLNNPENYIQPINYSHKTHAGKNNIECVYCHTNAEKGAMAGIPSLNVCMNCHKFIAESDADSLSHGIDSLRKYMDYNSENLTYGNNKKPISWIRTHYLADVVHFNHSVHLKYQRMECFDCHGRIDTMEVVVQVQEFSMNWCLDCHNKEKIHVTDYYKQDFLEFSHQDSISFEKIGGKDCSVCHK